MRPFINTRCLNSGVAPFVAGFGKDFRNHRSVHQWGRHALPQESGIDIPETAAAGTDLFLHAHELSQV